MFVFICHDFMNISKLNSLLIINHAIERIKTIVPEVYKNNYRLVKGKLANITNIFLYTKIYKL